MWDGSLHVIVFAVCCFVAGTAVLGGIGLMAGLWKSRYLPELLDGTPFGSYVGPGLVAILAVGGSAAFAAAVTAYNPYVGGIASMIAACILMGSIIGEIYMLRLPWNLGMMLEFLYFACGLVLLILGYVLQGQNTPI